MKEDITKREEEVWGIETYYFYCPVCDKSYNIDYDASSRTAFDGKYENNTCFIKKGKCQFCETKLYVAYDADRLRVVAYDTKEEKRWRQLTDVYSAKWNELKKIKKELKENKDSKLEKKKDSLKKECKAMEKEIIHSDEQYEEQCELQMIAREQKESAAF
ncbi:MAG: hypothetical protein EHM86_05575 [Desulfobulbaceae bacterium]|nr:MAG: hypothetical protein EHM86_05575 [Desulfobulbaceae bacterium]